MANSETHTPPASDQPKTRKPRTPADLETQIERAKEKLTEISGRRVVLFDATWPEVAEDAARVAASLVIGNARATTGTKAESAEWDVTAAALRNQLAHLAGLEKFVEFQALRSKWSDQSMAAAACAATIRNRDESPDGTWVEGGERQACLDQLFELLNLGERPTMFSPERCKLAPDQLERALQFLRGMLAQNPPQEAIDFVVWAKGVAQAV